MTDENHMQCELSVSGIQENATMALPVHAFAPVMERPSAPIPAARPVQQTVIVDPVLKRVFGLFAAGIVATLGVMGTLAYTVF